MSDLSESSSDSEEDIDFNKTKEIKITLSSKNKSKNGKIYSLFWDKNCNSLGQGKGEFKPKKWLKTNKKRICKQLGVCEHHTNWTVKFQVEDKKYDAAVAVYSTTRGIIKPGIDKLVLRIDDEECDDCLVYKFYAKKKNVANKKSRTKTRQNKRKKRRRLDECLYSDDCGDATDSDQYDKQKESVRGAKAKKPPKRNARLYGKLIREVTLKFGKKVDSKGIVAMVNRYLELKEEAMFDEVPADIFVKYGRQKNADRAVNHYNYPPPLNTNNSVNQRHGFNYNHNVPPPNHKVAPNNYVQQQYPPPP
eukprot:UN01519